MIRYSTFPKTQAPAPFAEELVGVFRRHEKRIATEVLEKGLTSDGVLATLAKDLTSLGFTVETGKTAAEKIERPVFFGENGKPSLRYQIDGYNAKWRCGIEVEARRAWMGNAIYRDLIQASLMVDLDFLCLAVSNGYRFKSGGRNVVSKDYENTRDVAEALWGHSRLKMPYGLLLIGY